MGLLFSNENEYVHEKKHFESSNRNLSHFSCQKGHNFFGNTMKAFRLVFLVFLSVLFTAVSAKRLSAEDCKGER